jgi:broad specificity phosphatase PhoE
MPVVVLRHAEREDYGWARRGESWQAQAARPWDTPLTVTGHQQAAVAGRAVARHVGSLGLPAVTRVFSSPLLRCCQTACGAATALGGIASISVDPSLAETICENWYRSWAVDLVGECPL